MRFSEGHAFGGDEQGAVGAVVNGFVLCGKQAFANADSFGAALQETAAGIVLPQKNGSAHDGNEAKDAPIQVAEDGHLTAVGVDGGGRGYAMRQQQAVHQGGDVLAGRGGQGVVPGEVVACHEAVFGKEVQGIIPPKEGLHIISSLMGWGREGRLIGVRKEDAVGTWSSRVKDINAEVAAAVGVVAEIADVEAALRVGAEVFPVVVDGVGYGDFGEELALPVGEVERGPPAAVVVPPKAVGRGNVQAGGFGELCRQAGALFLGEEGQCWEEEKEEE